MKVHYTIYHYFYCEVILPYALLYGEFFDWKCHLF